MPTSAQELEAEVLSLPDHDRARILERLIASFEPRSPSETAWLVEAQRRRQDVKDGKVAMIPGDEALSRVRARIE
ncbi:MAG: addiction module protein [Burkholderiaceae bacterium]